MNPSLFLKVYFNINILFIGSYGFYQLARLVAKMAKREPNDRQLIAVAQVLIYLSILAPLTLQFVPSRHLPAIEWKSSQLAPDDGMAASKRPIPRQHVRRQFVEKKQVQKFKEWVRAETGIQRIYLYVFLAIIMGMGLCVIRLVRNLSKLRTFIKETTLIRSLGHIRIAVSDVAAVPFSVKLLFNSWVVLPVDLLTRSMDFKIALKHELQHHRQRDTAWAIFVEVLLCFFFPNPAIYLWKREVQELQEFSCDAALVGRQGISLHDYGSCLMRVAEAALGARSMHFGTMCMASVSRDPDYRKSFLRRRVEMFIRSEKSPSHPWAGVSVGALVTTLTIAIAFGAETTLRNGSGINRFNPGRVEVDPAIQNITESALSAAIVAEHAKAGFAIVSDPNTGRVLAVANVDTTGKRSGYWSLGHLLEPASLAKTLVAAEAMEKGLTTPQETHNCENGNYRYGDRVYHDWKDSGWDHLTTEETIALSGDICSMKIGEKIGAAGLRNMLVDFGFGPQGTAKFFPGARSGQLPPQDDLRFPRLVPYVSVGFGFRVTPLEMLQAYGAIANGGNLMMPQSANAQGGQIIKRVLTAETARQVREILRQVGIKGTAKGRIDSELYSMAGKTATSHSTGLIDFASNDGWGKGKADIAGFIGFAPVQEPKVEVYVGIIAPNTNETGAHGSSHAAPVFRDITEQVLKHLNVAPDKT